MGTGRFRRPLGIKPWFMERPVATLGALSGIGLILGVEMFRATFLDLPTPGLVVRQGWNQETLLALLLWIYALGLVWAASTAWGFTRPQGEVDGLWEALPNRFRAPARVARRLFDVVVLRPTGRLSPFIRRSLGLLTLTAGAALFPIVRWASSDVLTEVVSWGLSDKTLEMIEVSLSMVEGWGIALGLLGLWLLTARFDSQGTPTNTALALARSLAIVVVSAVFGTLLWFFVDASWNRMTWRGFTMWAVVHIGLVSLAAGRAADGVGQTLRQRFLIAGCMLAGLAVVVALPVPVGYNALNQTTSSSTSASREEARFKFVSEAHSERDGDGQQADGDGTPSYSEWQQTRAEAWFEAVQARIGHHSDEPVIFVAAAGGGSRSALYATLVLEALERTPTHGDFGDWSKPEEATVEGDDAPSRSLADRLVFISSVSGGSVANAQYTFDSGSGELSRARNTLPGELRYHLLAEIKAECGRQWSRCADEAGISTLSCLDGGNRSQSLWQCVATGTIEGPSPHLGQGPQCTRFVRLCASPDSSLPGANEGFDPHAFMVDIDEVPENEGLRWPVDSKRFDELATDFTAPLLRGVVYPGIERGESMSAFWSSEFSWQEKWRAHPERARAVMLINIANVKTGAGVVAGFPDLPPGLLRKRISPGAHTGTAWLQAASGARALADIHAHLEVDVEEAVRMSANFPYGFDLPRLGLGRDLSTRDIVVDGGVLDNTGISTFAILMERLDLLANPLLTDEVPPPLRKGAQALLDNLAERGVVLLEVDSGGKPLEPSQVEKTLANLFLPLHSLSTAAFVRASEATRQDVRRMEDILASRMKNKLGAQILTRGAAGSRMRHVRYVLDTEGLMTAWGLTPRQKGHVMARFLAEDVAQREVLRDAYEDLEGRNRLYDVLTASLNSDPALTKLVAELAEEERELTALRQLENESAAEQRATGRSSEPSPPTGDDGGPTEPASKPSPGDVPAAEGWASLGFHLPSHVDTARASLAANTEAEAPPEEEPEARTAPLVLLDSTGCTEAAPSPGPSPWLVTHVRFDRSRPPCKLLGRDITLTDPLVLREDQPEPTGRLAMPVHLLTSGTRIRVEEVGLWPESGYVFARVVEMSGDVDNSPSSSE